MSKIKKNFGFLIPVITFSVLVVFMAGCEKKTEKNKAIISNFYEEIEKGNLEIIGQTLDTNCVLHFPIGVVLRGPDGYKEHILAPFLTAFPDSKHVIEDMIAEGDKVVARFTVPGTHKGEYMGINPTGKQVTLTSVAIYRIVNDKFVEIWCEADNLGFMQQLGVIPPIGQGEE